MFWSWTIRRALAPTVRGDPAPGARHPLRVPDRVYKFTTVWSAVASTILIPTRFPIEPCAWQRDETIVDISWIGLKTKPRAEHRKMHIAQIHTVAAKQTTSIAIGMVLTLFDQLEMLPSPTTVTTNCRHKWSASRVTISPDGEDVLGARDPP